MGDKSPKSKKRGDQQKQALKTQDAASAKAKQDRNAAQTVVKGKK